MFVSSIVLYLLVRKSSLSHIPSSINNLAMFLVPVMVYAAMLVSQRQRIVLTSQQFFLLVFAALILSYLGNVFSLKSIEYAPNPGYSLVISKSYVVLTTLLAVVFFGAHISIEKALAIVLIVGFSALIMTTGTAMKKSNNLSWFPYAVGSFFLLGISVVNRKVSYRSRCTSVGISYLCQLYRHDPHRRGNDCSQDFIQKRFYVSMGFIWDWDYVNII